MDLSVLIVNWKTRDYLRDCLQAIRNTVKEVSHEVIVVDNDSQDGSAEMVREEFPEVDLIASDENLGFAVGNNLAYERASGRHLLIVNPDIVLKEDAARTLVDFADSQLDAGIVSPMLLNPDGTFQNFYGRIPTLSTVFFLHTWIGSKIDERLLGRKIFNRERYVNYGNFQETVAFTDGGPGFHCILVPRRVVEDIGFFDEYFPVFFNDGDLGIRLFKAGYKAYIFPGAQAYHHHGSSIKQLSTLLFNQEWIYGLRAYYRKHRGFFYNLAIDLVLSLNVAGNMLVGLRDILTGKKGFSELFTPVKDFVRIMGYRPPNAQVRTRFHPGGPSA